MKKKKKKKIEILSKIKISKERLNRRKKHSNKKNQIKYFFRKLILNIIRKNSKKTITKKSINFSKKLGIKKCYRIKKIKRIQIYVKKIILPNLPKSNIKMYRNFYSILTGLVQKRGKKYIARKMVNYAFENAIKILEEPIYKFFKRIIIRTGSFLETRNIRFGRKFVQVPIKIGSRRARYKLLKRMIDIIKQDIGREPYMFKIERQLVNMGLGRKTKLVLQKHDIVQTAVKNRSYAHFRW